MRADLVDNGFRWMTQKTALQLEPVVGIEPTTYGLRTKLSTYVSKNVDWW
jgi:hypothetical protein